MKIFKCLVPALAGMAIVSSCGEDKSAEAVSADNTAEIVVDNIMTRTSVRRFTSEPVGRDTLDVLVKAGMAAPTAVNKQPWAFVVVTERAVFDSLMNVHPWSNLQTASAAIVVCGDMQKALDGFAREYWVQDCSAATENILLAAHAYGLGAVWCGVYPNPDVLPGVKRILGLPDAVTPLNIITLGHPAQNVEPKDKWVPENVHYQRW